MHVYSCDVGDVMCRRPTALATRPTTLCQNESTYFACCREKMAKNVASEAPKWTLIHAATAAAAAAAGSTAAAAAAAAWANLTFP